MFALVLLAGAGVARGQVPAPEAPTPATAQPPAGGQPAGVTSVAPTAAVLEKLASGDRALQAGDQRGALFAYQDAVYAQPAYAASRVKLGRAYLAMRYPDFAMAQAEAVLKGDPANPDALALLGEARRAPPRALAPGAVAAPAAPPAMAPAPAAASPAEPRPSPRAFKLTPEPAAPAGAAPSAAAPVTAAAAPAVMTTEPLSTPAPATAPAPAPAPAAPPQTAAQRYRTGVELIGSRDYQGAVSELSEAIAIDPRLAVAYAARASARFGLGKYREAADDYKAALGLDPGLATPLYGLAECYRQLGDPAAVEMYHRYADSKSADVREDLRTIAAKRAAELSGK